MESYNFNNEVIIYPNDRGWFKIIELFANSYKISDEVATEWINKMKTEDGGFRCQLWVIIQELHEMFFNGQRYFKTMEFNLNN